MRKLVLFLLLFLPFVAFCQDFEMVRHQVKLGETVRMISKKYKVEPAEIYRLNKFAVDGIREGMVLQLLVPKKAEATVETPEPVAEPETGAVTETVEALEISHTVAKGETLYSLSRKYNVPVDDIKALNEDKLKNGLKTGQVLTIRTKPNE